ncbi:thioredoxin-dependent thiol peroxidase [Candidatus Kapaibacterium sp.]
MALETGVKAPDFSADTDGSGTVSLKDYSGKWVVLYFYPKDDTSGCTKEACSFRDNMERITGLGAVVLGVSPDKASSHKKFSEKYNLNFILASDTDKSICTKYDIMGEKSMYGKKYLGVIRTTYIINPKGNIAHVFSNVKVEGHTDAVIGKLQELRG